MARIVEYMSLRRYQVFELTDRVIVNQHNLIGVSNVPTNATETGRLKRVHRTVRPKGYMAHFV
ncbi:hypothetical protein NBRC116583_19570 [Arenicella sp. 4NH20-0111]